MSKLISKEAIDELILRRDAAASWILSAQNATPDGGVSAWYHLDKGWCPSSYPEVTGYIIPTFFDLYKITSTEKFRAAAIKMAEWLVSIQLEDGSFTTMPEIQPKTPYVFDTGQAMAGLLRSWRETEDLKYLKAAEKAGLWLCSMQRDDGSFPLTPFTSETHTYHARVSWILLQLFEATGNEIFKKVAIKNLKWVLTNKRDNDWITPTNEETTHFIAYAVRGLLESGYILKDDSYLVAAQSVADRLLKLQLEDGSLYGSYDSSWKPTTSSSCLTGNLQVAIIWLRLYNITRDERYFSAARKSIEYVSKTQDLNSKNPGVRGGIAGSNPIDGSYCPRMYLPWAAKFFIDAVNLLLKPDLKLTG
jgi:lantibiotic modifying enzyme